MLNMIKGRSSVFLSFLVGILVCIPMKKAHTIDANKFWFKIKADTKEDRTRIANMGLAIENVREGYVFAVGNEINKISLSELGILETSFVLNPVKNLAFPKEDSEYHDYAATTSILENLANKYPNITKLSSIGKSVEGRNIWALRISGDLPNADKMPATIYLGGHHAREHLSVELPLRYAQRILEAYASGDQRIVGLVNSRDIHIIPAVNPDGLEFDISDDTYHMWRKNRARNEDGTYGVDLNRNYGFKWGTGGSSSNPESDTYKGPNAFSEPETQAIKKYVEEHVNITTLLSFHTFSQMVLFPWGHKYDGIDTARDKLVHETMAKKMAEWNHYTPKQASSLYIASGDTTDWAYGEHKIVSFTFELDPGDMSDGGFYPGAAIIGNVVDKNWEPVLYLLSFADNPYRSIETNNPYDAMSLSR